MFAHRVAVSFRGIKAYYPPGSGIIHINALHPGSYPANKFQQYGPVEKFLVQADFTADDDPSVSACNGQIIPPAIFREKITLKSHAGELFTNQRVDGVNQEDLLHITLQRYQRFLISKKDFVNLQP